jgi:hypothetical protein
VTDSTDNLDTAINKPRGDFLGLVVGGVLAGLGLITALVVRRKRRVEQEKLAAAALAAAALEASQRGFFGRLRSRRSRSTSA